MFASLFHEYGFRFVPFGDPPVASVLQGPSKEDGAAFNLVIPKATITQLE